jgi:hypothetical protein
MSLPYYDFDLEREEMEKTLQPGWEENYGMNIW